MPAYLEPTQAAGRDFIARASKGPVMMLNLLRLREVADYSAHPELAPPHAISGAQALDRYIAHTLPRASGGDLSFHGSASAWLIGPDEERWDRVMLVRQHSAAVFLDFASNPAYLAGLGHRLAAIEDSRLLAITMKA
ncbi:hypothetical protein [Bordetella avium]|uniref:DUF1330 domain-containing protein n=1 Tax=Bordetella avium (strain 197N) TaxID=360910 RepID=Q2KX24_BORA1|nr:hypothetical protein [Bordetella avium]RIQ51958.1 DUF1330 domain-containing protein [Bordetella avium]RIQ69083.1 DUF1330 domain-containing protein [Bordetella avium]CAJ50180.1 conserved hypothetical protein [Bordetella avium 197N]